MGCWIYGKCIADCKKIKKTDVSYGGDFSISTTIKPKFEAKIIIAGINCLNCETFKDIVNEKLKKVL